MYIWYVCVCVYVDVLLFVRIEGKKEEKCCAVASVFS